jgi:hypothetical protein
MATPVESPAIAAFKASSNAFLQANNKMTEYSTANTSNEKIALLNISNRDSIGSNIMIGITKLIEGLTPPTAIPGGGKSNKNNKNNKDNKNNKKEKRGGWAPLDTVAFQNYGNLLSATQSPMVAAGAFDANLYAPVSPNTGLTQPISSTVNVPPNYRNVTDANGIMQSGGKSKNRKTRGGSSSPSAAPVLMSDIGGTSLNAVGSVLANATNSVAGYSSSMLDTTNSALNSLSLSGGARRKKNSKK